MSLIRAFLLGVVLAIFAPIGFVLAAARLAETPAALFAGQVFCSIMIRVLGLRVRVEGHAPVRNQPRLAVANHVSWLDPLVLGAVEPFCPLAKSEVASWPVISRFAKLQGAVFVNRARRMQIPRVNRELAAKLLAGRSPLLFPEGTTYDGSRRGRFLTSHLGCLKDMRAASPTASPLVQCIAVTYSHPDAAWIGDATLLPHLWTILRRPGIVCTLRFGSPVAVPADYDRKALGRRLAEEVEGLIAAPARPAGVSHHEAMRHAARSA